MTDVLQKLRSFRVYNLALFDFATAIPLPYILRYFFPANPLSFYAAWTFVLFVPLGVVAHYVFSTPTQLNRYLGLA